MTYEELLRQLGASLGLSGLTGWRGNETELLIDGMAVRLRHLDEAGQVEIEADLSHAIPLAWDDAAGMLAANFIGAGAPDAVCSVGPAGVARLSMRHRLASLSCDALTKSLERFAARLERQQDAASSATKPCAPGASPEWQVV